MKVRRDGNESEILRDIRRLGIRAWRIQKSDPPGLVDLFIWFRGRWHAVELKSEKGRLSGEQQELVDIGASQVARSTRDVLRAIGAIEGG